MHVGVLAIALTDSRAVVSSEAKRQLRSREHTLIVQIGTLTFYTRIINYVEVGLPLCSYFLSAPATTRNHQADQQPTEIIQVASDHVLWVGAHRLPFSGLCFGFCCLQRHGSVASQSSCHLKRDGPN